MLVVINRNRDMLVLINPKRNYAHVIYHNICILINPNSDMFVLINQKRYT